MACVEDSTGRWLLGLSTANDDRNGTYCFPGGGIKRGEDESVAAVRECREETGLLVKPVRPVLYLPSKPGVAFVHCRFDGSLKGSGRVMPNHEHSILSWFNPSDLPDIVYHNVRELIEKFM